MPQRSTAIDTTTGPEDALDAAWHLWRMAARDRMKELAESGTSFTADDITDVCGLPPVTGSPNAVGGLFIVASRAGLIEAVGVSRSRRPSRHAGLQRCWKGTTSQASGKQTQASPKQGGEGSRA